MRKAASRRRVIIPLPPRCLRPKLPAGQVGDLGLVHYSNLDSIVRGTANEMTLWNVVEASLTWSRIAEALGTGEPEMCQSLELASALITRYGLTGSIEFVGDEYRVAADGAAHMHLLAEIVDAPTAVAAVEWSNRMVRGLELACKRGPAALAVACAALTAPAVMP